MNYNIHLCRIHFSDHNPGYDEVAEGTGDDEDVDAGDWDPGVLRREVVILPELHEVHVYCQDYHGDAATETWN